MSVAYPEATQKMFMPEMGTGATLYGSALLDADEFEADKKRTHIVAAIEDPVLRDVLETFQDTLIHQLAGMVSRISSWSMRGKAEAALSYGAINAWGTRAAKQYWLPNNFVSMVGDVTLASTAIAAESMARATVTSAAIMANSSAVATVASVGSFGTLDVIISNSLTVFPITGTDLSAISLAGETRESSWFEDLGVLGRDIRTPMTLLRPAAAPLAVEAVENIADWLGVPAADIFRATGIKKRTYQAWKKTGTRRPRASSEGRLWELHQLAADLVYTMGTSGVRSWLSQDPAGRRLLRSGALDEFASRAYTFQASTNPRPAWVGAGSPENHLVQRRPVTLGVMDKSDVVEPDL